MEKVRLSNETQAQEIQKQIDEKLRSADEKRDEMLKQLREKLRLHVITVSSAILNIYVIKTKFPGGTSEIG